VAGVGHWVGGGGGGASFYDGRGWGVCGLRAFSLFLVFGGGGGGAALGGGGVRDWGTAIGVSVFGGRGIPREGIFGGGGARFVVCTHWG